MIYLEYDALKRRYLDIQETYDRILQEKERLFQRTQPKSTMGEYEREFDKSIKVGTSGGSRVNLVEEYVIAIEDSQINERLAEAESIMLKRRELLEQKEQDLRRSKNLDDELYTMRYLERMRIKDIAKSLMYSEAQIYRRLKIIRTRLKDDRQ